MILRIDVGEEALALRIVALDERDRFREGSILPGPDTGGERLEVAHHRFVFDSARRLRAMTIRWISLVPSPIVQSFTSR